MTDEKTPPPTPPSDDLWNADTGASKETGETGTPDAPSDTGTAPAAGSPGSPGASDASGTSGSTGSAGSAGTGAPPPPPPTGDAGGASGTGATPPPPPGGTPPAGGGEVSENRQLMIVLSYLGILALIPYAMEQRDPEVRWHSRNGLALFVADIIITLVLWVVSMILSAVPFLGCIFVILWMFIGFAILGYHIFVMLRALKGERYRIPYVTEYAEKIP